MKLVNDLKSGVVTLDQLQSELGIKLKMYEDATPPRVVLNYCQIESPKSHPYVMQSRGLIINLDNFDVLCRPFDRFFNMGEVINHAEYLDFNKAICHEKVDGSLIKIYWDGLNWCIATRGTAFAESTVGGWDLTFRDLVLKALGCETYEQFHTKCLFHLSFDYTYLFEVTAMENRVVTNYSGYALWYLAARHNVTGEFFDMSPCVEKIGAVLPSKFSFDSVEHCMNTAARLPDLREGYVIYQDGVPFCKVKSPAYVAVHHLRGEGLNPKRICELVLTGETAEYLKYFPEDESYIQPTVEKFENLVAEMVDTHLKTKHIQDQKEYALSVKDYKYSGILFSWKKVGGCVINLLNQMPLNYRLKLLMSE